MKILALETTERIGSVATHDIDKLLHQKTLDADRRTAESLSPAIKTILDATGWKVADLDLVAVTIGPGSFTGLRIGVTTAKTLAYAAGAEVLGIDTLEAIAVGVPVRLGPPVRLGLDRVAVAIDAQRGEVVAATFEIGEDGRFTQEGPQRLLSIDDWLAGLATDTARPARMAVSGPIVRRLLDRIPEGLTVIDERYRHPTAAAVAELAARAYREGRRDDLWKLVPKYSRRSAAEERWEERNAK